MPEISEERLRQLLKIERGHADMAVALNEARRKRDVVKKRLEVALAEIKTLKRGR